MRSLTAWTVRHRALVWTLAILLVAASLFVSRAVVVNYELANYLPKESGTSQAIAVMKETFGYTGSVRVMVEDVSLLQAKAVKDRLAAVEGVDAVVWLDDLADLSVPLESQDPATVETYYKDGAALYQLTLSGSDYDPKSGETLERIRALDIEGLYLSGASEESRGMRSLLNSEIAQILWVVVPFCVLVLLLASSTWIEPLLYLAVIGVSIALNMGTNVIFNSVSFITHAMASVLQLAISLDYSIFLFHRYLEERDAGASHLEALQTAGQKSFSSISASALTTIAGFLALLMMRYSIGRDIGLVLTKGIVLSFSCVLLLMPPLIYLLSKVIDKTRHRVLRPPFGILARMSVKGRFALMILLVLLVVPAYLAQRRVAFLYGDNSGSAQQGDLTQDREAIEARFGAYNPVILLLPSGEPAKEAALADALAALEPVGNVQCLATLA
ncbi:MAG TPA: MMPL family transporter, partial [Clostridia bacterium]|nr:MMPL family transporter [Clostridia bacterium]